MTTSTVYRTKAENYARYRWHYAQEALDTLIAHARLSRDAVVADIGAGTGILTMALTRRFNTVFAVEPNAEMRFFAERDLTCTVIKGSGEATGLASASVDLVTVAQALHWMEPVRTRAELRRILKPDGWLAIFHNNGVANEVGRAIGALYSAEYGFDPTYNNKRPPAKPLDFYFGHQNFVEHRFTFEQQSTREAFLGALGSAANSPAEDHPRYPALVAAVDAIFDRYAVDGRLPSLAQTKLTVGQPR